MARFDIHPLQLLAFIGEYLALVYIRKGLGPQLIWYLQASTVLLLIYVFILSTLYSEVVYFPFS
jgi:hypothetical protein